VPFVVPDGVLGNARHVPGLDREFRWRPGADSGRLAHDAAEGGPFNALLTWFPFAPAGISETTAEAGNVEDCSVRSALVLLEPLFADGIGFI
jgi:hypothetical protein